ncbi:hypothetical protein IAT38_005180 [Cryptococcus sp. DSM 104549]
MDEEASFANLLSSTALPARPSWEPSPNASPPPEEHDPWANPFAASADPYASPFGASSTAFTPASDPTPALSSSTFPILSRTPPNDVSPYVQQLEREAEHKAPDPPSVIAAREQELAAANGRGAYASSAFASPYDSPSLGHAADPHADPFGGNPFAPAQVQRADPAAVPFAPEPAAEVAAPAEEDVAAPPSVPKGRKLPSGLIDEDLMAESDPEQSLKKAFKKSAAPVPRGGEGKAPGTPEKKAYVFTPSQKKPVVKKEPAVETKEEEKENVEAEKGNGEEKVEEKAEKAEEKGEKEQKTEAVGEKPDEPVEKTENGVAEADEVKPVEEKASEDVPPEEEAKEEPASAKPEEATQAETTTTPATPPALSPVQVNDGPTPTATTPTATSHLLSPTSIPLPASAVPTPTISRNPTPLPPTLGDADPSPSPRLTTPSTDRVSVSPLDSSEAVEPMVRYKYLSVGGVSMPSSAPPPVPSKDTWGGDAVSPPASSRFGGKGWGVLDEDEDAGGLFGKGGPSVKADPWGGNDDAGGWGEPGLDSLPSAQPSASTTSIPSPYEETSTNGSAFSAPRSPSPTPSTPSHRKKLSSSLPLFQISVSDPTRVGDAVRGYTVYTIRTRTSSPHYRQGELSALRRFSDFLWLYDQLTHNNPGVIVPPVPDKHTWGRFQDQFVETRRRALERCLRKITSHPVLQLDPDLRLFLESDSFAHEAKNRKQEVAAQTAGEKGLLAGWTGSKFVENDDWFNSRKTFLDSLENQLKGVSKAIESSSKHRLDLGLAIADYAESLTALAESDLGASLSAALAQMSLLAGSEKDGVEEHAKSEVVELLNMADEYVRFIGSVRGAFAGRVKGWEGWQQAEREVTRLRANRERLRQQGKLGDRVQSSLAEIADAERRAREGSADFDRLTKLVKSEFARFERERVLEFKATLERYLDGLIEKEKEMIESWETFHGMVARMVEKSQGVGQQQGQQ